jgi:hypothetical protein
MIADSQKIAKQKSQDINKNSLNMEFSSEDLKTLRKLLEENPSKSNQNVNMKPSVSIDQEIYSINDEIYDPQMTTYMSAKEITNYLSNKEKIRKKVPYKNIFLGILIFGAIIGIILGMIVNFGLGIL